MPDALQVLVGPIEGINLCDRKRHPLAESGTIVAEGHRLFLVAHLAGRSSGAVRFWSAFSATAVTFGSALHIIRSVNPHKVRTFIRCWLTWKRPLATQVAVTHNELVAIDPPNDVVLDEAFTGKNYKFRSNCRRYKHDPEFTYDMRVAQQAGEVGRVTGKACKFGERKDPNDWFHLELKDAGWITPAEWLMPTDYIEDQD